MCSLAIKPTGDIVTYPTWKSNYLRLVILITASNQLLRLTLKPDLPKAANETGLRSGKKIRYRGCLLVKCELDFHIKDRGYMGSCFWICGGKTGVGLMASRSGPSLPTALGPPWFLLPIDSWPYKSWFLISPTLSEPKAVFTSPSLLTQAILCPIKFIKFSQVQVPPLPEHLN